jgi:fructose-1-phosphate kinase PfkB-like protein
MSTDNVSLAYELAELEDAVRAARLVVEMLATDAVPAPGQEQRVAVAAAAALHLVEARVHLVARVVRGDALVAALAADHNRVRADGEDDEDAKDVILRDRADEKPRRRGR